MTPQEMTEIRNKRILAAFNLEKPDRMPINLSGQGFYKFIDPTMTIADIFRNGRRVDELNIQAFALPDLAEMDSGPAPAQTVFGLKAFAGMYFAKVKIPGFELPDNALWNIEEFGSMEEEDYDVAIDKGWGYMTEVLNKRIDFDPSAAPAPDPEYLKEWGAKVAALGKSNVARNGFMPLPSFEILSGARKMPNFYRDVRRMPDKIKAVVDVMDEYAVEQTQKLLKQFPAVYGFIGGTRAGSDFISKKVYETLYHPFYQKMVKVMAENNTKTWFHNDSDWTGFLDYFKEFPKAQCIFDPDQLTPIENLMKELSDIMCIEGNVPPAMIAVGTPDECYKETKRLMGLMGDKGVMMGVGCGVPINGRRENLAAVIAAVTGK